MLYFPLADYDVPCGGVRVIYRHVDILNDAGIPARVLHQKPGFRCTWFDNTTATTDIRVTGVGPDDVVVVPELDVDVIARLPRPVSHIILNQSGHLTWRRSGTLVVQHYLQADGLLGNVVVSDHSARLLSYTFPHIPVARVRTSIDTNLFRPGGNERPRRLVYIPRRGAEDNHLVLNLLRSSGDLGDWEVRALDNLSQSAFAAELRTARITLSLSYQEGFGLPALEAMASGSYVIGYHGYGGQEFLRPPFACPLPTGDVLAVAQAVAEAIRRDDDGSWCRDQGLRAAAFVRETYTPEAEIRSVVDAYCGLLERPRDQLSQRPSTVPSPEGGIGSLPVRRGTERG